MDFADPFVALEAWMAEAEESEAQVPDATQVATVGPDGRPSLRTVLLRIGLPEGLVFFTNYGSRKARELDASGHVALLLHWKSLERQVIVEGTVARASAATSDAYWATRPRGSQLGAWASHQSQPGTEAALRARLQKLSGRFEGQPVPRPDGWGGYVVTPTRFEFWQGKPDRLHDRRVWTLVDGDWQQSRLDP